MCCCRREFDQGDPPAASAEVHVRYHPLRHAPQQLRITPLGLGHKVMQRLAAGAGVQRVNTGGHGFDAFADNGSNGPVQ